MQKILLPLSLLLALQAFAQTDTGLSSPVQNQLTPIQGDGEFSIGGSGSTDKDFDNSFGGVNFGIGYYFTDTLAGMIRQTVNYANPSNGGKAWNGWTRLAVDQHFGSSALRPFVGVNAGRTYGDSVRDTWTAGLEGGAKYYVRPRTFIQATVEYGWFFQHSRDVEDRFDDGQWNWSLGVGFNF